MEQPPPFTEAWWVWYREIYLLSPGWRERRLSILNERGNRCERCGITSRLEVHHLRYAHVIVGEPEHPDDLEVLCWACHDETHSRDVSVADWEKVELEHQAWREEQDAGAPAFPARALPIAPGPGVLVCTECGAASYKAEVMRWRAYLDDDGLAVIFCPDCSAREFETGAELQ